MNHVVVINGGNSFSTYTAYRSYLETKALQYEKLLYHKGWKDWLAENLDEYDVLIPEMPNPLNAVYDEWAIYFEKVMQFVNDDFQLVGHSLGANFLAKYLNANRLANPAKRLILVAGGFADESGEELGSFKLSSVANLSENAKEVHLFHSKDDPVVPFTELAFYQKELPNAEAHIFDDRGHFFNLTPTFPELLELLKQK